MSINENGIGSNYKTLNNDPISHFNDDRISVEIYPTDFGEVAATVSCDQLDYSSGMNQFSSEQEANLFAINLSNKLISILDAKLNEAVLDRLVNRVFHKINR